MPPGVHTIIQYFIQYEHVLDCKYHVYGFAPVYSGKQMASGDLVILFSKMSFLLRKRMMEVSLNHLLLQMESNSFRDSCMRFCRREISKVLTGFKTILKVSSKWTVVENYKCAANSDDTCEQTKVKKPNTFINLSTLGGAQCNIPTQAFRKV